MRYWSLIGVIAISCLLSVCNTGFSADDTYRTAKFAYTAQQSIDGNGFFNTYQKISTIRNLLNHEKLLGYGELSHGSGSYKRESTLSAWSQVIIDEESETLESSRHNITFGESTDYVYKPVSLLFGKTLKFGPIASNGKEDTCVKDYDSGVSMSSLFDSTTAFSKEITGSLYWDLITRDNVIERLTDTSTGVALNINADVTGLAKLGMRSQHPDASISRHPITDSELEQDYRGTFTISQKLSHNIAYKSRDVDDEWLPCCYGGYLTMPKWYQMGTRGFGSNVKAIFDCTSCFEPVVQLPAKPSL